MALSVLVLTQSPAAPAPANPHGLIALGVRALVLHVRLLRAEEVGEDVAGGLLLALAVRAELLLVLERHLAVQNERGLRERLIVALSCVCGMRASGDCSCVLPMMMRKTPDWRKRDSIAGRQVG
jgi:hypothetical protein